FEIKWDGIRAIAYSQPGRWRMEGRRLTDITSKYPELRPLGRELGSHSAVLDGEIVAFGDDGRPSFERLQHRMHLTGESRIKRQRREELVMGGWCPGEGKRESRIGALHEGYHDPDGNFRYGGRVGTGFKERDLDCREKRLEPLRRKTSPFASGGTKPPRGAI